MHLSLQQPKLRLVTTILPLACLSLSSLSSLHADQPWQESYKLLPGDGINGMQFGNSVAISDQHALIGARFDNYRFENFGSGYIFDTGTGQQLFKLLAPDAESKDELGASVALAGDLAILGAVGDDVNGANSGSVYLFDVTTGQYITKLIASNGAGGDQFGFAVAARNDRAIISAPFRDGTLEKDIGTAYIFDLTTRQELFKLSGVDGKQDDEFGRSVAISTHHAIVGAWGDDDNGNASGSAYVFSLLTGQRMYKLLPADGDANDQFGVSVAIDGDYALVGAFGYDGPDESSGAVYVFDVRNGQELFKLTASDAHSGDLFGISVALSGNFAVIGALRDDDNGLGSGSAYVFDVTTGVELGKILASDGASIDEFGNAVAISGDQAVIAAHHSDDFGPNSGSAYLFQAPTITCLDLLVDNLVAGQKATIKITNGTAGAKAVTVYGTNPGQTTVNNIAGYCVTFGIKGINQNKILGGLNRTFDNNGEIQFDQFIPQNAAGLQVLFQSAEQGTCPDECVSNVDDQIVQ